MKGCFCDYYYPAISDSTQGASLHSGKYLQLKQKQKSKLFTVEVTTTITKITNASTRPNLSKKSFQEEILVLLIIFNTVILKKSQV